MTVSVQVDGEFIRIVDTQDELTPATKTTLRLYGFVRNGDAFEAQPQQHQDLMHSALELLNESDIQIELDGTTAEIVRQRHIAKCHLEDNLKYGAAIKAGDIEQPQTPDFLKFLVHGLKRSLLQHQVKAALHLVNVAHGANFSVPGAGKTSVVLAVYEYLRLKGLVNSLFVVGPRSCFMPWQTEFELTLGRRPSVQEFAGGDARDRRSKYYSRLEEPVELYLTTYHTLSRDKHQVQHLLSAKNSRAFFIIDEGHYMKQDDGVWARAVAETSNLAVKRCVLTGTPFPRNYGDGINQFDVLYPNSGIFDTATRRRIRDASEVGQHHIARKLLEPRISSVFYRVRKSELGLSPPVFLPPIRIAMNPIERELYLCIQRRIGELVQDLNDLDLSTVLNLQKGRQIRRRQSTSYSALLLSAIDDYEERLIDSDNEHLADKIHDYDQLETPAKLQMLVELLETLNKSGEKVVIWATFVGTLKRIKRECDDINIESRIIYGGTPLEDGMDEESRETIIESFKQAGSGLDVLIANPAACAESVSLHKTCSNAIYYDLSYNCAEYLQSLDRIHRVGGSEEKVSFYRFLQYADTFEDQILRNLSEKTNRMSDVIDQDFPLALSELPELGMGLDDLIT